MGETQFWAAIDELEGCADEASVHELHELLLEEDQEDVAAFQRHLAAPGGTWKNTFPDSAGGQREPVRP